MILVMDIPALQKLKFDAIENDAGDSPGRISWSAVEGHLRGALARINSSS